MTGKAPAPRKSTGAVTPAPRKSTGGAVPGKTVLKAKGKAAQDPRFQKTLQDLQNKTRQISKHEAASKKRGDMEKAAQDPANARSAGAAASQVATMDGAPTGTVQPSSFTTLLRQEIDRLMPQTLENADQFMQHGEASQIQQAAGGAVQQQTDDAAGTLQATAAQAPDPSGQPVRTPVPVSAEAQPSPPSVEVSGAVPPAKKNFDAGLKQNLDSGKDEIKKTELPETSFQKANDSRFSKVTEQNQKLQAHAAKGVQSYPKTETQIQSAAKAAVSGDSKKGTAALVKARVQGSAVVRLKQQTAKERNEARRKAVVDNIERIYNKTKAAAQNHIEGLQDRAMQLFEQGLNRASENLKRNAELEKQKFRAERYSGVTGAARWVADLFRDCPDGLKEGFRRARAKFTQETDVLVNRVGQFVDSRIKAAKAEIQRGQAEIQTYVQSLPADLQSVGQNAQKDMESRFTEMQQSIDSQAQELAQKLAERYQKAQEDADNAIKKLEEENSGMLGGLVDAIGEVIKILREFKARLQAALRKGEETIKLILNDPIGFLSNLLAAIKGGLNAFVGNIWTHLKAGFMQWLFGSLMKAGIQPPADLSLSSIFKLVLQVLGITHDRMRAKAVRLIGERNVKILEKLYEHIQTLISGGIQALWEKVKEDLGNLKQMVIDAIQNWLIETVIRQAVMKVVSMFNPAGAIVQAVILIYNTVMFLWEKASQILSFVEAVINSIHAIATGAIGGAISWIERSLASMIPLVIGFLARLIGLGNVSSKIREFIMKVQGKVDAAIDRVIAKIVATVKKLFGKGKADPGKDTADSTDVKQAVENEAKARIKGGKDAQPAVNIIRDIFQTYSAKGLKSLKVQVKNPRKAQIALIAIASPPREIIIPKGFEFEVTPDEIRPLFNEQELKTMGFGTVTFKVVIPKSEIIVATQNITLVSDAGTHAEQQFEAQFPPALRALKGKKHDSKVIINAQLTSSPCMETGIECATTLSRLANQYPIDLRLGNLGIYKGIRDKKSLEGIQKLLKNGVKLYSWDPDFIAQHLAGMGLGDTYRERISKRVIGKSRQARKLFEQTQFQK